MGLSVRALVIIALIALSVFLGSRVASPAHAQQNSCMAGDANNDGRITVADYVAWRNAYLGLHPTTSPATTQSPTPATSATPPPQGATQGIWLSKEEIMARPVSGAAWDRVKSAAASNWGSPCLYDNNCNHDVNTLAGALVAVRMNDGAMRNKVIVALTAAVNQGAQTARVLELSRGLQTYVIAADIIGYRTPQFEANLRFLLNKPIQGHSGGTGIVETAELSGNNWGGHARATLAAAAIYLNDATLKQKVVAAYNDFIGVAHSKIAYEGTTWHADSNNKAGENRKGAVRGAVHIGGVLTEDWRRAEEFKWPPTKTGYMWEGMQGFVVSAIILHRAGLVPFTAGDNAVVRAMDILYGTGEAAANVPKFVNAAEADDTWIPWVINYYANTSFPAGDTLPGKNIGWTDWTHKR